jgi:hypothetical protein
MFVTRIREEFRAEQPHLRITNLSAMISGKRPHHLPGDRERGWGGWCTIVFYIWGVGEAVSP